MKYQKLLNHIEEQWDRLKVDAAHDSKDHLILPNSYIAPSAELIDGFVFQEQFYWDTYFTALGLQNTKRENMIKGMTENLLYMYNKFGHIPNSNNLKWHSGRSQPPVLSMLINMVYRQNQDKEWLGRAIGVLEAEYKYVWLGSRHPNHHRVHHGLSRYYSQTKKNINAEDESGWDYTTRFDDRALDWLPIDLNSLLYKYEIDFMNFSKEFGRDIESKQWAEVAELRKIKINKYMWNFDDGLYYDFDFVNEKMGQIRSLAAYFPMFVGMADEGQVEKLVTNLKCFETEYGLTATDKSYPAASGKQWASPNGWAPLHYIVIKALSDHGFDDDAKRIAMKWVDTVNDKFLQTGVIFEKYNVVNPQEEPVSAIYPDQRGFAWTNAITARLIDEFSLNQLEAPAKHVYTEV